MCHSISQVESTCMQQQEQWGQWEAGFLPTGPADCADPSSLLTTALLLLLVFTWFHRQA